MSLVTSTCVLVTVCDAIWYFALVEPMRATRTRSRCAVGLEVNSSRGAKSALWLVWRCDSMRASLEIRRVEVSNSANGASRGMGELDSKLP